MSSPSIEQRDPDTDNPVASFEAGIVTVNGAWVGICIKFAMYDKTTKLTHWSLRAYEGMMEALQKYGMELGAGAFMFRAHNDPSLTENLPPRHPYHTLLNEVPKLTESEVGTAQLKTGIDEAQFVFRGPTFEIRPQYGDGRTESIFMDEYTALSLWGYLKKYMEAAATLVGPAEGNA